MASAIGRDLPVTFGWTCAGVLEAVGPDVTAFDIGDTICAYPEFGPGGIHADFMLVDASKAAAMPAHLIQGAAAAVGNWLIQLARAKGAQVITTASGQGCDDCRSLGADRAIG